MTKRAYPVFLDLKTIKVCKTNYRLKPETNDFYNLYSFDKRYVFARYVIDIAYNFRIFKERVVLETYGLPTKDFHYYRKRLRVMEFAQIIKTFYINRERFIMLGSKGLLIYNKMNYMTDIYTHGKHLLTVSDKTLSHSVRETETIGFFQRNTKLIKFLSEKKSERNYENRFGLSKKVMPDIYIECETYEGPQKFFIEVDISRRAYANIKKFECYAEYFAFSNTDEKLFMIQKTRRKNKELIKKLFASQLEIPVYLSNYQDLNGNHNGWIVHRYYKGNIEKVKLF